MNGRTFSQNPRKQEKKKKVTSRKVLSCSVQRTVLSCAPSVCIEEACTHVEHSVLTSESPSRQLTHSRPMDDSEIICLTLV